MAKIPGVGLLTATYFVAFVGSGSSSVRQNRFQPEQVHGARAVASLIGPDALLKRRHHTIAVVPQASTTTRIMWSMLVQKTDYRTPAKPEHSSVSAGAHTHRVKRRPELLVSSEMMAKQVRPQVR